VAASFIEFEGPEPTASGKTSIWNVRTEGGGMLLGQVKWFGRWRCYAFYPGSGTIFERTCLRDIASFCETETQRHREEKAATK